MSRYIRWTVIIANAAAAVGVFFFCRSTAADLPETLAVPLIIEQQWLIGVLALYIVNFVAALQFRNSYAVSAGRMLLFAAAAFVIVSHAIDIIGEHRALLPQVFSFDGKNVEDSALVAQIQARLAALASMTTLCLACIAVGFESSDVDSN